MQNKRSKVPHGCLQYYVRLEWDHIPEQRLVRFVEKMNDWFFLQNAETVWDKTSVSYKKNPRKGIFEIQLGSEVIFKEFIINIQGYAAGFLRADQQPRIHFEIRTDEQTAKLLNDAKSNTLAALDNDLPVAPAPLMLH